MLHFRHAPHPAARGTLPAALRLPRARPTPASQLRPNHPPNHPPRSSKAQAAVQRHAIGASWHTKGLAGAPARTLGTSAGALASTEARSSSSPGERQPIELVLQDGTTFSGHSFGAPLSAAGEVVFNTGMVGYPESLTDPSYRGQILVMTYPLVGNYGVPGDVRDALGLPKHFESDQIQVKGVVVSDYSEDYSHWLAARSLEEWLVEQGVPAITGVDTRALTQHIRDKGSTLGKLVVGGDAEEAVPFYDPNKDNLVAVVSRKEKQVYSSGAADAVKILAIDCGMKHSIVRALVDKGADVTVVPWDHDIVSELEYHDGLFLSNGPGNPNHAEATIANLRQVLEGEAGEEKPIFGICMGHQLLAMAAGACTYKLPFGHRGHNQPCIDMIDQRCYITSQNHGYAVDDTALPSGWHPYFVNANDQTSEGIAHATKPFFSVQFHPEARGGPEDTAFLFDRYLDTVRKSKQQRAADHARGVEKNFSVGQLLTRGDGLRTCIEAENCDSIMAPTKTSKRVRAQPKKVLILGSGGLSIGQAGEFDYSGSQAIKALKEENISTVLINPNIATVQTAPGLADQVYFLPVTAEFVEGIIEKEKPDGIMLQFGGQTALNCGVELAASGVLERHGVEVLGTSVDTIVCTEDRDTFASKLNEINEPIATSQAATSVEDAARAAEQIGYPVIIRAAFSLGGLGSGFAHNKAELSEIVAKALAVTPQVLVEECMKGWKEVEYEVVRDADDNCVTVCNMENFDPLGIHTGDSIVVAPSQTLDDHEYHMLRTAAIRIVRHLGVIGECNVQYALHPTSRKYCVIEVNPRLSRSSALASKATGYPLAFVAAKLALGYSLPELRNSITKVTSACFEPSLDYVVTKIPRWDLGKFPGCDRALGSAMKSVGEVMAVGRTFEESFQKALRMVDGSAQGYSARPQDRTAPMVTDDELKRSLSVPTDQRLWHIRDAMDRGYTVDQLHELTRVDRWFLHKLKRIQTAREALAALSPADAVEAGTLPPKLLDMLQSCKRMGFSDEQIAQCLPPTLLLQGKPLSAEDIRAIRISLGIVPAIKQIDTLAAEYPAHTNYLYSTYSGTQHDIEPGSKPLVVLGAGAYCIGNSVEFDYTAVSAIRTLRELGKRTAMINFNPETVSTDYDESDRLYFEELSLERVLDICDLESPEGVVVSVGGQIPNNMATKLASNGVQLLGTSASDIDRAEDRSKFSALCDSIDVDQPEWAALTSSEQAYSFAERVGYPVLVRPSYVLSGAAMRVIHSKEHLGDMLAQAAAVSKEHPVVISKFIEGCLEIELDGVADKGQIVLHAVSEHIEQAGVHSGDASLVLPPQALSIEAQELVRAAGAKVVEALRISGPFNAQFIVDDLGPASTVKIIECNVRASRSFPFVGKVLGVDLIQQAARVFLGLPPSLTDAQLDRTGMDLVGVKVPNFSFPRLPNADPVVGVEMASTGEVACFGANANEAFIKAMMGSINFKLPQRSVLVSSSAQHMAMVPPMVRSLQGMGFLVHATPATAAALRAEDLQVIELSGHDEVLTEEKYGYWEEATDTVNHIPSAYTLLKSKMLDFCFNFDHVGSHVHGKAAAVDGEDHDARSLRRAAVDFGVPVIVNPQVATFLVQAMQDTCKLQLKHSEEYQHALLPLDSTNAAEASDPHAEYHPTLLPGQDADEAGVPATSNAAHPVPVKAPETAQAQAVVY